MMRMYPNSLRECFNFDETDLNPTPKGFLRKIVGIYLNTRWSMTVLMRLSQYFHIKSEKCKGTKRTFYIYLSAYLRRKNQILNNFEHGANPKIAKGIVLHHPGVTITSETVIETGVHIYKRVTFGTKNKKAPYIKKDAKIASHSIVLGPVTVGEKAIVAPGAVVVKDVPDRKIAAGVPAKIIGKTTEENYSF